MTKIKTNSLRWLGLGVVALAIAGIFAVILVAARTPQLAVFTNLFSVALVIHVDLSVLVWFLCVACFGWSNIAEKSPWKIPYWQSTGFYTVAVATALIALSPLDPHWEVIKSNYIPVLNNPIFLGGLALLMAGLVVMLLPLMPRLLLRWSHQNREESLFLSAAFTTILALLGFLCAAKLMPNHLPVDARFEQLFWAGGHILQFTFTLLMMAGWAVLAETLTGKPLSQRWVHFSCILAMVGAMASFWGFVKHPFDTAEFTLYQTKIMIELGGLGAVMLAILIIPRLMQRAHLTRVNRAYASSLIASFVLFFAGGFLGLMISGQNVTIPAHYHGAIVGITLALMGYAYAILPRYGYPSVASWRLAFWQPIIYGIGQLMHIGGLAYSGGYGVLRKTPAGVTPHLSTDVQAALGFMGLGGLLAIIGGLLFVVVISKAYLEHRRV